MVRRDVDLQPVDELKIDKDCIVDPRWTEDYVNVIISTCKEFGISVLSIKKCKSRSKGEHYYIKIGPPIDANLANELQWLLGDDARRVDFNRARIASRLPEWSKLFEEIGVKLRTIYRACPTRR